MRGERTRRSKGVSQQGAAGWGHAELRTPDAGEGSAWLPWTVHHLRIAVIGGGRDGRAGQK